MNKTQQIYFHITLLFTLLLVPSYQILCKARYSKKPENSVQAPEGFKEVRKLYVQMVPVNKEPVKKDGSTLLSASIRDLSLEELHDAKDYAIKLGDPDTAIKYIERILLLSKNHDELCSARLELADCYFENGAMKRASKMYAEYVSFYPGSSQSDYAEYKAVLSNFYSRLTPPLDQQRTRKTIRLAQTYLERSRSVKKFNDEVSKIQNGCYQDILTYELDIFNGYLKRNQFTGAKTHLKIIKNDLLPVMKDIEPLLVECEIKIAQKQKNNEVATERIHYLETKFPDYNSSSKVVAQAHAKKSFLG